MQLFSLFWSLKVQSDCLCSFNFSCYPFFVLFCFVLLCFVLFFLPLYQWECYKMYSLTNYVGFRGNWFLTPRKLIFTTMELISLVSFSNANLFLFASVTYTMQSTFWANCRTYWYIMPSIQSDLILSSHWILSLLACCTVKLPSQQEGSTISIQDWRCTQPDHMHRMYT